MQIPDRPSSIAAVQKLLEKQKGRIRFQGNLGPLSSEAKVRTLVNPVFEKVYMKQPTISREEEMTVLAFKKKIKPDIVFLYSDVPFLIVELKKNGILEGALAQHLRQMRDTAISYSLPVVFGLMTTYSKWIFLRYSLQDEVAQRIRDPCETRHILKSLQISQTYKLTESSAEKLGKIVGILETIPNLLEF